MALKSVLVLVFLIVAVSIFRKRSPKNNFHLDYFLYHILLLFLIPVLYIFLHYFDTLLDRYYFTVGAGLHLLSFVFMLLHVESSVKGAKAKVNAHHIIPFIVFLVFATLDVFNIYIFNHPTAQELFYDIQIVNPTSFNNILFIKQITSAYLYAYLINSYSKNIKKSATVKKKNMYTLWVYSYISLFILSVLSNAFLFYGFFDAGYNFILIPVHTAVMIMNIFYFIATPSALHYLPLIKVDNILHVANEVVNFNRLKALFEDAQIFLDPSLSLRRVSLESGINEIAIRKLLKSNTGLNFNDFVNQYRIEYAITIMQSGFLDVNLITTLGEKSGFKSNHTFYRAFKKLKKHTPSNYYKNHLTA